MESCSAKHKVVLIGDPMVGKTAILTRLIKNYFFDSYMATVGTGFGFWDTVVNEQPIRLQIWDTAGQEQYRSLGPIFYQNAEAAIICYSQANPETSQSIEFWADQFRSVAGQNAIIAIAANQMDQRENNFCQMETVAREKGYIFHETSAKTGIGVRNLFQEVADLLIKKRKELSHLQITPLTIKPLSVQKKKKGCCS